MSKDIEKIAKRLREIVTSFPEDQSDLDRAADALEALAGEVKRITKERDDLDANGIHTCHDNCTRHFCVMRRRMRDAQAERDRLKAAIRLIASHGDEPGALSWDLDKVLTLVDGAYKLRPR